MRIWERPFLLCRVLARWGQVVRVGQRFFPAVPEFVGLAGSLAELGRYAVPALPEFVQGLLRRAESQEWPLFPRSQVGGVPPFLLYRGKWEPPMVKSLAAQRIHAWMRCSDYVQQRIPHPAALGRCGWTFLWCLGVQKSCGRVWALTAFRPVLAAFFLPCRGMALPMSRTARRWK